MKSNYLMECWKNWFAIIRNTSMGFENIPIEEILERLEDYLIEPSELEEDIEKIKNLIKLNDQFNNKSNG
mgnify:CR=1 FL=1